MNQDHSLTAASLLAVGIAGSLTAVLAARGLWLSLRGGER